MRRSGLTRGTGDSNPGITGWNWSRLALIAANLLPLAGVVFLGWDLLSILLLYWLETLMIGALAMVRAVLRSGVRSVFQVLLFLLVFTALNAAHLTMILLLAEALDQVPGAVPDFPSMNHEPLFQALQEIYASGFGWIAQARPELLFFAFPVYVVSQLLACWPGPQLAADRVQGSARDVLRGVLSRVVIMHLALLSGSAVIAVLDYANLLPVLALMILLKLAIELRNHRQAERVARPAE